MSAISSLLGNQSTTGSSSSSNSSSNSGGLTALTPGDFVNFLVTELQNQDPMNPTDPGQMLSQISEIGQLQSSNTLETDLQSMVQQNQVASASGMIGKAVQGVDSSGNPLNGNVTSVQVTSNAVNLGLDNGMTLPISSVTSITNPSSPAAAASSSSSTGSGSTSSN